MVSFQNETWARVGEVLDLVYAAPKTCRSRCQGERRAMQPEQGRPTVNIAPNNPVFDLPVIVGIEEGLFAKAEIGRAHV